MRSHHRTFLTLTSVSAVCAWLMTAALGQEATRPSLARQKPQPTLPKDFNLRTGPILLRLSTGLRMEFVDNVNLSSGTTTARESDFIFNPQLGIDAAWPITKLNTLRLRTTLGYTKYVSHPELDTSSVLLSPDSELSFDVFTGDFKINFHDQFSYQEDPIGEGALSNTAKFGRFTNVAGVSVLWDLNDLILSAGYDHINFITTSALTASGGGETQTSDTSRLDRASDQVFASGLVALSATMGLGLEGTARLTRFPEAPANDATSASVGPFFTVQVTRYTKLYLAAGYRGYFPKNDRARSSVAIGTDQIFGIEEEPTEDASSYYANLIIAHRLNRFYSERLAAGHESEIGLFAQRSERDFVTYTSIWQLTPSITLNTTALFENVEEFGSSAVMPYRRLGLALGTSYQVTRKLSASLEYGFTQRLSEREELSYRQNRFVLGLRYQF